MNAVRTCAFGNLDAELHEFPWMRRAPHQGFAVAIFLTSAAISVVTGGRPPDRRPDIWV
jgi:hypothetical protein